MSTRTRRTRRNRMFIAAALAAAALSLTACNNGEGVLDEGAPAGSVVTESPRTSGGTLTGTGQSGSTGSATGGSTGGAAGSSGSTGSQGSSGSKGSSGSSGTKGSSGSTGSTGSKSSSGSSGSEDSDADRAPCTPASTRTTATEVSRPINHLLLTVTNTGSKICDLAYYPSVAFSDAQSVPPVFEDSQPQAVVTLAPGESGYASVLLSAADGSGGDGRTVKSLDVYFNVDSDTPARPSLPAKGVYIDDSIHVTYWQREMADALDW